ncbi:hypothetical protein CYLTODRAFT_182765 [Cylindrobasidium torrendii FP15055 ss-10]|uniref:Uncharacterized protein n=1 Tax=Cylindrobasidium torrendii FP15055 ss-10 TaxID=1314674 RepID=A0A0D7AWP2_9AGAR|nr:hypothetical protein CYLTODRAFT_182765 [Cylindrobasidium torrendii FP15055 ss-10]
MGYVKLDCKDQTRTPNNSIVCVVLSTGCWIRRRHIERQSRHCSGITRPYLCYTIGIFCLRNPGKIKEGATNNKSTSSCPFSA